MIVKINTAIKTVSNDLDVSIVSNKVVEYLPAVQLRCGRVFDTQRRRRNKLNEGYKEYSLS